MFGRVYELDKRWIRNVGAARIHVYSTLGLSSFADDCADVLVA
jgi:hypothetical protein